MKLITKNKVTGMPRRITRFIFSTRTVPWEANMAVTAKTRNTAWKVSSFSSFFSVNQFSLLTVRIAFLAKIANTKGPSRTRKKLCRKINGLIYTTVPAKRKR